MSQDHGRRGNRLLLATGIVGTAFCLRLVFASLSVRLPEVVSATGLQPWQVGVLTTLPVLCLGLCAPLTPLLARRWGTERSLFGALLVIALGTALRVLGPVWRCSHFPCWPAVQSQWPMFFCRRWSKGTFRIERPC